MQPRGPCLLLTLDNTQVGAITLRPARRRRRRRYGACGVRAYLALHVAEGVQGAPTPAMHAEADRWLDRVRRPIP